MKPFYNDTIHNDNPVYNDISISPGQIPIYLMYLEPPHSDNQFLDKPVYNDNFTSLKSPCPYFSYLRKWIARVGKCDDTHVRGRLLQHSGASDEEFVAELIPIQQSDEEDEEIETNPSHQEKKHQYVLRGCPYQW